MLEYVVPNGLQAQHRDVHEGCEAKLGGVVLGLDAQPIALALYSGRSGGWEHRDARTQRRPVSPYGL